MTTATFVKELTPSVRGGTTCLVELNGNHYVISSIPAAPDHGGPETLAFAADENGEVTSWADLAGGPAMSRDETIAQLVTDGENPYGIADQVPLLAVLGTVLNPPGSDYYVSPEESA